MNNSELEEVLEKHGLWLDGQEGGERANLRGDDLRGAYLRGANLRNTNLENVDLTNSDLRGANIKYASLYGANLEDAYLEDAYLEDAYLEDANLRNTDLENADLYGADLRGANLKYANLMRANLMRANLSGANLQGAKLWETIGDGVYIKNIFTFDQYSITYTHDKLQIGCEHHSLSDWESFSDERILEMDGTRALEFWKKNKEYILNFTKLYPARESRYED